MNTRWPFTVRFLFAAITTLLLSQASVAEIVELTITGHWSEKDFKVTSKKDGRFDPANPKFDGFVFGVAPAEGSVAIQLLVNTDACVFFANGSEYTASGVGSYTLAHDFYGYRNVTLVGGSFTFGRATWKSEGILSRLDGPDGQQASLWTDSDITKSDPTKVSFRMFGKAESLTPDIFVGSRTHSTIDNQFLLWEYYRGEEIRSYKYKVSARVLRD